MSSFSAIYKKFEMLVSPFKCLWGKEIILCIKCKITGGFLPDAAKRSEMHKEAISHSNFGTVESASH